MNFLNATKVILYKFRRKIINKFKNGLFRKRLVKRSFKFDLIIYDTIFPHPVSGFRYEEFKVLLSEFYNSKIFLEPTAYPLVKTNSNVHKIHILDFKANFPQLKNKVSRKKQFTNINTKLFYCVFLNTIYSNLYWLEKYNIPFIFTLYPGGGFKVGEELSDNRLHKVLNSPQFKKIIVTQLFTKNYLIDNGFCAPNKIEYIFGGVVPQVSLNTNLIAKINYPNKKTFDIVFCAAKYMPKGVDKGYDVFIELAHSLIRKYDFIRFHVVGGFDKDDINVSLLGDSITFYGYQNFESLGSIYTKMDVILSPNKPFHLDKGAFDGFPLGTVVEAVLNGVVAIVTDTLNQNTVFEEGKEIIIINDDINFIEKKIIDLISNPEKLLEISQRGRIKFLEVYSNEYQMNQRIGLLKQEIEKYKHDQRN